MLAVQQEEHLHHLMELLKDYRITKIKTNFRIKKIDENESTNLIKCFDKIKFSIKINF